MSIEDVVPLPPELLGLIVLSGLMLQPVATASRLARTTRREADGFVMRPNLCTSFWKRFHTGVQVGGFSASGSKTSREAEVTQRARLFLRRGKSVEQAANLRVFRLNQRFTGPEV